MPFVEVRILALCARASTPDCSNIVQKCIKDALRPKIESLHFGASVKNRGKLNWKKIERQSKNGIQRVRYHIETEALAGKYILNKQFGTTRPLRAGSEQVASRQKARRGEVWKS